MSLGLIKSITASSGDITGRRYIKDGLKLYMPYRGTDNSEVQFVGTGSTSFDGSDDYVLCGDDTSLDITDDITMMAWVKPASAGQNAHIIGRDDGSNRNYVLYVNGNVYTFDYFVSDSAQRVSSTTADTANVWVHLACTRDKTTGKNIIYVNGVAEDTDTDSTTAIDNDDVQFSIGCRDNATSDFTGNIKNAAIWNRALTATEIQNVMYKTYPEVSGRLASGLVSWWALDASSLGSELTTNGDFSSWSSGDPTGWSAVNGAVNEVDSSGISGTGSAQLVYDGVTQSDIRANSVMTSGKLYRLTIDVKVVNSGDLRISDGSGNFVSGLNSTGVKTYDRVVAGTNLQIIAGNTNPTDIVIDDVSLKEINIEDLKGSNDGSVYGVTVDEDLYGGDTPVKPRAIDNAPTVQADAIGAGSALFDGTDDYISVGDIAEVDSASALTITAWIKVVSTSAAQDVISKKADSNNQIFIFIGGNILYFGTYNGGAEYGSVAFTDTDWVHIAMVFNGGGTGNAGRLKGYVNGVLQTLTYNGTIDTTLADMGTNVVKIGNRDSDYLEGNICQVGIWQGALTQEKIQSVMEKTFEELTATEKSSLSTFVEDDCADDSISAGWDSLVTSDISFDTDHYDLTWTGNNNIGMDATIVANKIYKITCDIKIKTDWSGNLKFYNYNGSSNLYGDNRKSEVNTSSYTTLTEYILASGGGAGQIGFNVNTAGAISIKNFKAETVTHDLVSYWALDEAVGTSNTHVEDIVDTTLGSELVVNGTFDADTNWNKLSGGTPPTISGGVAVYNPGGYIQSDAFTTVAGQTYKITFDIVSVTGSPSYGVKVLFQGADPDISGTARTTVGSYVEYITTTFSGSERVTIYSQDSGFTGTVDNVSCKLVNGNIGQLI